MIAPQHKSYVDLAKEYNFLFYNEDKTPNVIQVLIKIFYLRKKKEKEALLSVFLDPKIVGANNVIPLEFFKNFSKTIDIEIHYDCDGPKFVRVDGIDATTKHLRIGHVFTRAIEKMKASEENHTEDSKKEQGETIRGFIQHQSKNQAAPTTYEVIKTGGSYVVNKQLGDNGTQSMSIKSPKIKGIIKSFEAQLSKGTLQTEFNNS